MPGTQDTYERFDEASSTAQGQEPTPQPTAVIPSSAEIKPRETYKNRIFGVGIAECVLGGLSVICAVATFIISDYRYGYIHVVLTYTSQGIWGGAFVLITGILGVCIRKNPTVGLYQANMVLSIITAVFTGVAALLSGFASAAPYRLYTLSSLHAFITFCLLGGFILSIVHSAFCCGGVCKRKNRHPGTVVYIPQVQHHQQFGGIPAVQYVVPAGTNLPSQGYFMISPAVPNTNVAVVPTQQIGQPVAANMQSVTPVVGSASAAPAATKCPPGYSTLPTQ